MARYGIDAAAIERRVRGAGAGMSKRTKNPIEQLAGVGQSVWLDTISRDMIAKGELRRLVALGVRGVTSNPDIFHKAITGSSIYDSQIDQLAKRG